MTNQGNGLRRTLMVAGLAFLAFAASSCIEGDEPILVEPAGEGLFDRYVSLGNSLTAGFQDGGINFRMQEEAYPVLLAQKAGAPFGIPSLAMPGCPPPLVGPLTTERTSDEECALRIFNGPDLVQNLAVPGANTGHLAAPLGTGSILNTLILGGRTQLSAMVDADPTLVSVWIGNNDALGAALGGDTLALTPLATFQSQYDDVVDSILATEAQDAILIGVVNPMVAAPALQPGAYFWALAQSPPPGLPALNVSNNCSPSIMGGTGGHRLVSFIAIGAQIAAGADPIVIDCGPEAPGLLNEAEMVTIGSRIGAFNAYIQQQAQANGWHYVDPGSILAPALGDPNLFRKCQALATATDPASFGAAVQSSCPVDLAGDFFGSFVSADGIHPTAAAHVMVADSLAARLNAAHPGLNLP